MRFCGEGDKLCFKITAAGIDLFVRVVYNKL